MNMYDQRRINESPEIEPYFFDINEEIATRAYYATSHSPERAGSLIKSEYAVTLINDLGRVGKIVKRAERQGIELLDNHNEAIQAWFVEHRKGLKARYVAYLHSHSSVMSSMITGPARFPVARNKKRMGWTDNKHAEIGKFRHSSVKRLLRQLMPWGDGAAIASNDPKALDKISIKKEQLERERDLMKEVNKIARRFYKKGITVIEPEKHTECVAEIVSFTGYSPEGVELLLKPQYGSVVPFESYTLTNRGAEIRRLAGRLIEVKNIQELSINDSFECATVSISEKQQIAIDFTGKPNEEIRTKLKRNGFKWSRYQVAWVRKMTPNAIATYNRFIKPFLATIDSIA